jgi:hypothetical protein
MTFFEDLPEPPVRPRQPQPIRPGWFGPPSDELPGVVPGGFLYRSEQMVMAVKAVEIYSTGCLLNLVWFVRRGSETDQEWRDVVEESYNRPLSSLDSGRGLQLGVAMADGRKAVAAIHDHWTSEEDPAGPVLTVLGGGGGGSNDHEVLCSGRYWLWPLPLDGDTQLVAKWDELGVPESSLVLSASQWAEALDGVQNYWSG